MEFEETKQEEEETNENDVNWLGTSEDLEVYF